MITLTAEQMVKIRNAAGVKLPADASQYRKVDSTYKFFRDQGIKLKYTPFDTWNLTFKNHRQEELFLLTYSEHISNAP